MKAHRLVWEVLHGPIPEDLEINHINGDKADNRITNLELVTGSENQKHAFAIGLQRARRGQDNPQSELTETSVLEIYRSRGTERNKDLAERYGVSPATISLIWHGKVWGWLTQEAD